MDESNFVFLNTTNAPALSSEAAKRMRGHITKSNFAKRRQRIAENPNVNKKKVRTVKKRLKGNTHIVPLSDTQHNQDLQLLILLTCLNPPTTNPDEAAWVDLIASEPALVEVTKAVGMRHWSPQPSWQWQADVCSSKALTSIIQRISWRQTYSDGFLAAILTMAFSARLTHSDETWDMHIDGLVHIIGDRRSKGIKAPEWVCDALVL
jgi:hypothetical protein